jgi:hypothetical protein
MEEGASANKLHFGDRDMERQDISSQGMSKCRNAEMRKTPFWCRFQIPGVGVSKHFTTRNAEMPKCIFLEVHSVNTRKD